MVLKKLRTRDVHFPCATLKINVWLCGTPEIHVANKINKKDAQLQYPQTKLIYWVDLWAVNQRLWITGVPVPIAQHFKFPFFWEIIEISVIENKKEIENSNFTASCPVKRYVKVWLISVKVLRNSCGADDTQTILIPIYRICYTGDTNKNKTDSSLLV